MVGCRLGGDASEGRQADRASEDARAEPALSRKSRLWRLRHLVAQGARFARRARGRSAAKIVDMRTTVGRTADGLRATNGSAPRVRRTGEAANVVRPAACCEVSRRPGT